MKKNIKNHYAGRIISILIVLCMIMVFAPVTAFASVEDVTGGATETKTTFCAHVTYLPTNETKDFDEMETLDESIAAAMEWVSSKGGNPLSLILISSKTTFTGVTYSNGDSGNTSIYNYRQDDYYTATATESNILPAFDGEQFVTVGSGAFEEPHYIDIDKNKNVTGTISYVWNEGDGRTFSTSDELKAFLANQSVGTVINMNYIFLGSGDYIDFMDMGALTFNMVSGVDKLDITIDAPQAGEALATTAEVKGSANGKDIDSHCLPVSEIIWSTPDGDTQDTVAAFDTEYAATVIIRTDRGVAFADSVNVTVNGAADATVKEQNANQVKVFYVFDKTDAFDYEMIDGTDNTWTQNTDETLVFRANGDFSKFTDVLVDDELVDKKNYTAVSGSTIVTLKADYLNTLSVGTHNLTIVYNDGECSTNFEIVKATANKPGTDTNASIKETGDSSNLIIWFAVLFVSAISVFGIVMYGKRKKKFDSLT